GRVNMDVPITLAIMLATCMSIFESLTGGHHAYFEASTMLLFFLLIGRYLDQRMRERARNAVVQLSRLSAKGANAVMPNGTVQYMPLDEIEPGMTIRILPGERVPLDGILTSGTSDVDRSLITGESAPVAVSNGQKLESGAINLTGPIELQVTSTADTSFLAEVRSMMEAAENGRGHYVRMADRAARMYAPFVHSLSAIAFVMWMIFTGGDWKTSIYISIALLIITCPCALGLAVPVVHVIGAAKLFERGILMKDGAALERLAEIDTAAFDKTGTITTGTPTVTHCNLRASKEKAIAKALATTSAHPASAALKGWLSDVRTAKPSSVREYPGLGVEGIFDGKRARLGRASWVAEISEQNGKQTGTAFAIEGDKLHAISLSETLRDNAQTTIFGLANDDIPSTILSGDAASNVARVASKIGASNWRADCTPREKIDFIHEMQNAGRKTLMVGDGINDAPALAAGHVSMAPSSGSDVGRTAADFVFTRGNLDAVVEARDIALHARSLVRQNFALATVYNLIAVPIAMAGWVTPLVAAIAMSASSIVVVVNSMRLNRDSRPRALPTGASKPINNRLAKQAFVPAE
ncbi:MAG: heavy metal translocating P-type ATPase, partial [Pseudomonadota bacterium]